MEKIKVTTGRFRHLLQSMGVQVPKACRKCQAIGGASILTAKDEADPFFAYIVQRKDQVIVVFGPPERREIKYPSAAKLRAVGMIGGKNAEV